MRGVMMAVEKSTNHAFLSCILRQFPASCLALFVLLCACKPTAHPIFRRHLNFVCLVACELISHFLAMGRVLTPVMTAKRIITSTETTKKKTSSIQLLSTFSRILARGDGQVTTDEESIPVEYCEETSEHGCRRRAGPFGPSHSAR
jgi:hypothetical protein